MMHLMIPFPPLLLLRAGVAAVWLYEGLWCKVLGRAPSQKEVVSAVPRFGGWAGPFLMALGVVEALLGVWVLWGVAPGLCAVTQTVLLVTLNANGLLWARNMIHDPAGMVVKNTAFLMLAWVCGAVAGGGVRP
jgi:uncharacterized membrane protein YphA (DoxX/SURF4 family)